MPAVVTKLGPGTLSLGATATLVEFSCQVTSVTLSADVSADDPVKVLCGDEVPGARTYNFKIAGTVLSDLGAVDGIVDYSWTHMGTTVPFTYVPSDDAAEQFTGNLIVDPLPIGGDTVGANMTSDFEWTVVGTPVKAPAVPGALSHNAEPATV